MSRTPQTCADCARRKIKCNKVIPCDQCEKRGIAESCRRAEVSHNERTRNLVSMSPGASESSMNYGRTPRSDRVKQLESKLENGSSRKHDLAEESISHVLDHTPASSHLERPAKRARAHEIMESSHISQTSRDRQRHLITDEESNSSHNASDAEVEDAATVLEFLAWGRLKDSTLTSGLRNPSIPQIPEPVLHPDGDILSTAQGLNTPWNTSPTATTGDSLIQDTAQLSQIQDQIPTRTQVYTLVDFHASYLLFMHCAFHAPSMKREIDHFYEEDQGIISLTSQSLQWTALLFAILCGSITCANPLQIVEWGFAKEDQSMLAKKWYLASVESLNIARYQQYQNIYSVQAIATATISAHILGFSNSQSVNLAAAIRIAQSLGMHRLGKSKGPPEEGDAESLNEAIKEELSRRIWYQLATQDWFSVPFAETYCINPLHFNTRPPQHWDDVTMRPLPFSQPNFIDYGNFFFRIAALMPALLDRYYEAPSLDAKYEHVLRFDKITRELVLTQLPTYLYSQNPVNPDWPSWVVLARRALSISAAHKIIMIHRRFLGLSFHDKRFDFTRRTCLAAAKTIINEMKQDDSDKNPIFWTIQAFGVAAGIILALDNFNRHQSTREHEENRQLVSETISILSKSVYISSIASRGTRLLTELLAEDHGNGKDRTNDGTSTPHKPEKALNVAAFVKKFCEMEMPPSAEKVPIPEEHMPLWLQQDNFYQPPSYQYNQEVSVSSGTGYHGYPSKAPQAHGSYGIDQGYHMPSHFRRHHGPPENPFSLVTDNFDISSVTWFDDLLGLAPSHSI